MNCLKYQRFTSQGCKNKGIRKFMFRIPVQWIYGEYLYIGYIENTCTVDILRIPVQWIY